MRRIAWWLDHDARKIGARPKDSRCCPAHASEHGGKEMLRMECGLILNSWLGRTLWPRLGLALADEFGRCFRPYLSRAPGPRLVGDFDLVFALGLGRSCGPSLSSALTLRFCRGCHCGVAGNGILEGSQKVATKLLLRYRRPKSARLLWPPRPMPNRRPCRPCGSAGRVLANVSRQASRCP